MVLLLFRGPSEELIRERSTLAEVPFDRIVESIDVGFAEASDPYEGGSGVRRSSSVSGGP
jgi:hypothetical protein